MQEIVSFIEGLHKRIVEREERAVYERLLRQSIEWQVENSSRNVLEQLRQVPIIEWNAVLRFLPVSEFNVDILPETSVPTSKIKFIGELPPTEGELTIALLWFGDDFNIALNLQKDRRPLPFYLQLGEALDFLFIPQVTDLDPWLNLRINLEKTLQVQYLLIDKIWSIDRDRITQLKLNYSQRKGLIPIQKRKTFYAYPQFDIQTEEISLLKTYIGKHEIDR